MRRVEVLRKDNMEEGILFPEVEEEEEPEEAYLNAIPVEKKNINLLSPNIGSLPLNWGILY
jgi:hypothetical protein